MKRMKTDLQPSQNHLIFYDGKCGFCDCCVRFILKHDKAKVFVFAPLQGLTASVILKDLPASIKNSNSLILIENYISSFKKISILGKGALRICWLLGGFWKIFGLFSWLPGWMVNWVYCLIANQREGFLISKSCSSLKGSEKNRFLP